MELKSVAIFEKREIGFTQFCLITGITVSKAAVVTGTVFVVLSLISILVFPEYRNRDAYDLVLVFFVGAGIGWFCQICRPAALLTVHEHGTCPFSPLHMLLNLKKYKYVWWGFLISPLGMVPFYVLLAVAPLPVTLSSLLRLTILSPFTAIISLLVFTMRYPNDLELVLASLDNQDKKIREKASELLAQIELQSLKLTNSTEDLLIGIIGNCRESKFTRGTVLNVVARIPHIKESNRIIESLHKVSQNDESKDFRKHAARVLKDIIG